MLIEAPIHVNEANLPRVLAARLPVMLVFWQNDCAACERLAPALERLARRYAGRGLVVKVNVADEPGLARRFRIDRLPTVILFNREGQETARAVGAGPEEGWAAWLDYLTGNRKERPTLPSGPSAPLYRETPPSPADEAAPPRASAAATGAGAATRPITVTDASFDQLIRTSRVPVLIDFWAPWCGPCKMIAPAVEALAREFVGRAVVGKLNVDENPEVAGRFGIMSIPTLLIFKNGRVVDQIVGAYPAPELRKRLMRQL